MTEIIQLISNVGFPISAFMLMWYQNIKINDIIDKNTQAITELKSSIENLRSNIK